MRCLFAPERRDGANLRYRLFTTIMTTEFAKVPVATALLLLCVGSCLSIHGQSRNRTRQQTSFCEDQEISSPVNVSHDVAELLVHSDMGREALHGARGDDIVANPRKTFQASRVSLSDHDAALLVIGSMPMSGADNTWFWIVGHGANGPKILLWTGANCVRVLNTRTLGHRDIQSQWSSASETVTTTYKFDGSAYKQVRHTSKAADW